MAQFDRLFGILLALQRSRSLSATALARQFGVSSRTIYRDLETLSSLGVPLYSTRGHNGGVHLLEGFFLPPLTFTQGEGIALLLGLTLLQRLHAAPFPEEVKTAIQKLLVAVPDAVRPILARAEQVIGFEPFPGDIFHSEVTSSLQQNDAIAESQVLTTFLQGILEQVSLSLRYHSPYTSTNKLETLIIPLGLFWDRDHWYLVGSIERTDKQHPAPRLWRADRVVSLSRTSRPITIPDAAFDVQELLNHSWLRSAMERWRQVSPVIIRLTHAQAEWLQGDWFYRHAHFEATDNSNVLMTLGEDNQAIVFNLLRWLGPGSELLEPRSWHSQFRAELRQMLANYEGLD